MMKYAPRIEPEIVPAPPMSTIAMNSTDIARSNDSGTKKPVTT